MARYASIIANRDVSITGCGANGTTAKWRSMANGRLRIRSPTCAGRPYSNVHRPASAGRGAGSGARVAVGASGPARALLLGARRSSLPRQGGARLRKSPARSPPDLATASWRFPAQMGCYGIDVLPSHFSWTCAIFWMSHVRPRAEMALTTTGLRGLWRSRIPKAGRHF